ncbi:unnamed protein product [Phyllotreta striolata]|uniref:Kazal-like domain-containing protein n=1 Tax=Phyllotreta striolata TaxID=444603 RepID=A0A9N9TQD7_PHYSR|nr:unnamed protein product [Phyllotreta striolata]
MNQLTIIFIATLALGVSCLPPRVKRQFDWNTFNNPDQYWDSNNANTIRIPRQRSQESWGRRNQGSNTNWNQPSGRQLPQNFNNGNQGFNNPSDTDFGTGFNQGFNNPSNTDFSDIFNQDLNNGASSTVSPSSDGTTRVPAAYRTCMGACQYTREYNPVCGSDANTYNNRQELECARSCGRNTQLVRGGTCQPV